MNEALEFGQWLFDNAHKSLWLIHKDKWYYKEEYYSTQQLYDIWLATKL